MHTPSITVTATKVVIVGEPQNLEALGHALLLKAKLGRQLQITLDDGVNIPVEIISSDDLHIEKDKP